jgi:hypothetical protein
VRFLKRLTPGGFPFCLYLSFLAYAVPGLTVCELLLEILACSLGLLAGKEFLPRSITDLSSSTPFTISEIS